VAAPLHPIPAGARAYTGGATCTCSGRGTPAPLRYGTPRPIAPPVGWRLQSRTLGRPGATRRARPGHRRAVSARHIHPPASSRAERLRVCESHKSADRSQSRTSSSGWTSATARSSTSRSASPVLRDRPWGTAAPRAGGRLAAAGCSERTTRRSGTVTATRSTRLPQSWQRHSEPGPAARAEAVVAPPGTNRPGCARSRQGTEFAESRFRASRATFVRRQRPYRRSPRSRSRGCCSARAKRSSHRCRDKRCSVSSIAGTRSAVRLAPARPGKAGAAGAAFGRNRVIHLTQAAEDQHWGTRAGPSARVEPRAGTDAWAAAHPVPTRSPQPLPGLNLIQMDSPLGEMQVEPAAGRWPASRPNAVLASS